MERITPVKARPIYGLNPLTLLVVILSCVRIGTAQSPERVYFDDLKSKYSGEEFIYERTIDNSGWWVRFKKWLSDFFRDLFNFGDNEAAAEFTDLIINISVIIIFLLVIYFIFRAIVNREGTWLFGRSSDRKLSVTDIESNIEEVNFGELVREAESNGNFRLAIRYYYLWLLKALNASELIDYDLEKTNSDYYDEISDSDVKKEFSYSSYLYNYIWYGEFSVSRDEFDIAKVAFNNFLNKLKV